MHVTKAILLHSEQAAAVGCSDHAPDIEVQMNIYVFLCWKYIYFTSGPLQLHVSRKHISSSKSHFAFMAEQKQLWEINDVILNNNYSSQDSEYGVYYSLVTSRADLPAGFYASER